MVYKARIYAVLLAGIVLLTGCSNVPDSEIHSAESVQNTAEPVCPTPETFGEAASDTMENTDKSSDGIAAVEIRFNFTRMPGKASNQIAAWVEDESKKLVRTLYVTDFSGTRRGYRKRSDTVRHWTAAAEPDRLSDDQIDAVSGPTPQTGIQQIEWDLKDDQGNIVPKGKYTIKLEGTLYWDSSVVYSGIVDTETNEPGEVAVTEERSKADHPENSAMIQNVLMTERMADD